MKMKHKQNLSKKVIVFWEKLNYWQKGTIIGFFIGVLLLIISITFEKIFSYIKSPLDNFLYNFLYKFFIFFGFIEEGVLLPVIVMVFYGSIVGLILFMINRKYPLNRLSTPRFFALFGFVIILPFILLFIILESIFLLEGSMYITPFVLLAPLASIIIFTLYFYILGWVYNKIKKKTWWKLTIYIIIFLILFVVMWAYMRLYLFISLGILT